MRIRQGNDFILLWTIVRSGIPEDLGNAKNIRLHFKNFDCIDEVKSFQIIDGNIVRVEVSPEWASRLGAYRLILSYEFDNFSYSDNDRKCVVDVLAFNIVPKTSEADDLAEVSKTTDIMIGFYGLSAYEVWLKDNPDKTKEDYYNWLRQPATDAVSLIDDKIEHLDEVIDNSTENEAERVTAEIDRESNEDARIASENTRKSNEQTRVSSENDRVDAETDRVVNENQRVVDEGKREQLYDDTVILKTEVETLKTETETAKDNAITATNQINTVVIPNAETAIQNAIDVKTDYETVVKPDMIAKAQNAIEATDSALTAASLADTARLAIQDDLALKAAQADLVQLADEVSLLDAVQSAKIRDIENVLSTANLNQSAQLIVSGVSPLSLPKNAANGGMSVKLEGLTEDVGGVITNFEPTGRVRSVGKNLINLAEAEKGWIAAATGMNISGDNRVRLKGYLKVNPLSPYRVSKKVDNEAMWLWLYDANKNYVSSIVITASYTYFQISIPSTCEYIRWGYAKPLSSVQTLNLQLEKGSTATATTYEPYKETSLYLTAPELRSNGLVKDEIRKGANGYELVKRISKVDGTVLANPVITPISYGGVLNSASNGTVYHEQVIADAGVYGTKMDILLTDYPIASIEEIIKHENGVDTYLNATTAVIAGDGLSFTHPNLTSGDLVLFTYAFDKESTNGNITASFYDSNVVKIDTVTGKAYKINEVVTNGVLTRTLTEV